MLLRPFLTSAEAARQSKVMLAIEYLNRFECYFLTTAADALALVKRVDHRRRAHGLTTVV
jgi:sugar phosphate isomerase/epimerase